jgi:hypothetical protein
MVLFQRLLLESLEFEFEFDRLLYLDLEVLEAAAKSFTFFLELSLDLDPLFNEVDLAIVFLLFTGDYFHFVSPSSQDQMLVGRSYSWML